MTGDPFAAMDKLNRNYQSAVLHQYAGTFGGIKALVGLVGIGDRGAEEIMPVIQEAIDEHERQHEQMWTEHRRQLDVLSAQASTYMDELRRAANLAAVHADGGDRDAG